MNANLLRIWLMISCISMVMLGCSNDVDPAMDALRAENEALKEKVAAQDSIVTRIGVGAKFVNAYLDSLELLEAAVKRELQSRKNDSVILGKVKSITQLVGLNRRIVEDLRESLGEENVVAQILLDHVVKLDEKVKSREVQIAALNRDLAELGAELREVLGTYAELQTEYDLQSQGLSKIKDRVKDLEGELSKKEEELKAKETRLNTAYYFFGSKKELQSLSIIKKANLLTFELNENINLYELNRVDIRSFEELTIPTGAIKIISDHPASSYSLDESNGSSTVRIHDATNFWSITKTLIIQTNG